MFCCFCRLGSFVLFLMIGSILDSVGVDVGPIWADVRSMGLIGIDFWSMSGRCRVDVGSMGGRFWVDLGGRC